jgi:aspartyl-tRNA(Asn)/glutamyl-tRNA(Gln) amidotransferase subunit A
MINLNNLTIESAHQSLINKEYTVSELVQAYLDVINEKNPTINAYLELYDDVMEQASNAQKMFDEGKATMLTGIPIAVKDNILIEGKQVTSASKILEGYKAVYDATVIKKLKEECPVFIGRTNMDEFAMGSSTQTSAYGVTRNPLDETLVPGGSSGGPAAAVAMDGALVAIGSETCGSIRQPAAFCGLVGLKPTYGAVSRYGLMSLASSLDQISPIGKTVEDVEILYKSLAFHDPLDDTSVATEKRISKRTYGKRIGVPASCFNPSIDKEVAASFSASLEILKKAGYEIINLPMDFEKYSLAVYYIVMPAESSANLGRFDGIRYGVRKEGTTLFETYTHSRGEGFGREVRRRSLLGAYVLSTMSDGAYEKALRVRSAVTKEIFDAFEKVDFLLSPTAPMQPFKLGEKLTDPVAMYLSDVFSAPANLSGCPSIALPTVKFTSGLPGSLQVTAPLWCEDSLFTFGKEFEKLV